MHTKDILADALRDAGLPIMAARAAEGYYHDYLSPLAMPEKKLCERVKLGDYDASEEEEEAWASSPEGVAAMQAFAVRFMQRRA